MQHRNLHTLSIQVLDGHTSTPVTVPRLRRSRRCNSQPLEEHDVTSAAGHVDSLTSHGVTHALDWHCFGCMSVREGMVTMVFTWGLDEILLTKVNMEIPYCLPSMAAEYGSGGGIGE
jgi:hypothetical protein